MLDVIRTGKFKKEFALAEKAGKNMDKLIEVMDMIINERPLPPERHNHPLHGKWEGAFEPIPTCSKLRITPLPKKPEPKRDNSCRSSCTEDCYTVNK